MTKQELLRTLEAREKGAMPDQRSTTDQLEDLLSIAHMLGMYDAADFLQSKLSRS